MNQNIDLPNIVIFDGICNFCHRAVNFIIQRDPKRQFKFAPVQSDYAQAVMRKHRVNMTGIETFVLIKNGRCFTQTNAALEITKTLSGLWCLFYIFKIVPRPTRDYVYQVFARNRYRLFGRAQSCLLPSKEIKSRFIDL